MSRYVPSPYPSDTAAPNDEERALLFMRLWTLKEAFVKCRGEGIHTPPGLRGFSIGMDDMRGAVVSDAAGSQGAAGLSLGEGGIETLACLGDSSCGPTVLNLKLLAFMVLG